MIFVYIKFNCKYNKIINPGGNQYGRLIEWRRVEEHTKSQKW